MKPRNAQLRRRKFSRADWLVGLYGGTKTVFFDFVGRLMFAELIAIIGLLTVNIVRLLNNQRELRTIIYGFGVLLLGLVTSDIYNGTPSHDFLRGWVSILLCIISTIFLTAQFKFSSRAPYIFLAAMALGSFILVKGDLDLSILVENSNYFKARFVPVLSPVLILAACFLWRGKRILAVALLFLTGVIYMGLDARSSGVVFIFGSGLLFAQIMNFKLKLAPIIAAAMLFGVFAYGGYVYYVNMVLHHGVGGANAQQLKQLENPYNPIELLLRGRPALRVTARAILERPGIGFGSWARDKTGEYISLYQKLFNISGQGYMETEYDILGIIPAHSTILMAWLWGGICGLFGILIVCWTMVRLFIRSFRARSPLAPALCIFFVQAGWDAFFSPIAVLRTSFPFTIAFLVTAAYGAQLAGRQARPSASRLRPRRGRPTR